MEGPLDPFRERLPDFDDERLNAVARVIEHGRETADALAGMGSIEEIFRAVGALDDVQAQAALIVMAVGPVDSAASRLRPAISAQLADHGESRAAS